MTFLWYSHHHQNIGRIFLALTNTISFCLEAFTCIAIWGQVFSHVWHETILYPYGNYLLSLKSSITMCTVCGLLRVWVTAFLLLFDSIIPFDIWHGNVIWVSGGWHSPDCTKCIYLLVLTLQIDVSCLAHVVTFSVSLSPIYFKFFQGPPM